MVSWVHLFKKYSLTFLQGYNKPYIAPNYASYKEAFQGLANQGLLGFYKGNLLGLLHIWTNSFLRFQVFNIIESQKIKALDEAHYLAKGALGILLRRSNC